MYNALRDRFDTATRNIAVVQGCRPRPAPLGHAGPVEHPVGVTAWGSSVYGDPCRECGYAWSIEPADAIALIAATPERLAAVLDGDDGTTRGAGLDWSTGAYACHVADNLRIWAERLAGSACRSPVVVVPYDADVLARARRYESIGIDAALWSVARATADWSEAVERAANAGSTLLHPERGELQVIDVVRTNAHDAHHHAWDIGRILAAPSRP